MTDKNILSESTSVPLLLKLRSSTKRTSFFCRLRAPFCKHPGNTCPSARGSPRKLGELTLQPVITGSGGLALANHLGIPFTQEVIAVSTSLKALAPQTDVAIELGGEDAKIIYFEGGNVEQRMNGICAGGTGSFIDQMASLLQTDATGLNEYAKHYQAIYPIAARCGVFAKTDIQPLINDGATKRILPLLFSRQSSTRPFPVLPAVNQSAATLPSLAARCTSSRN